MKRWLPAPWLLVLAVLAMVVLLFSLAGVLRLAVQQGAQRRAAALEHSNAVWRCRAMAGRPSRTGCAQGPP